MKMLFDHSHRLMVIVGASGVGKDSVLRAWLASFPDERAPHRARRTITRGPGDASEDHEAISEPGFHAARRAGAFAFDWQAHGLHYGVRWSELAALARGRWVVLNGSRAHLPELRAAAPAAQVVEIVASDTLRRVRLAFRGREAHAQAEDRLARVVPDPTPRHRIANDGDLAEAVARLDRWWRQVSAPLPSR